jgi:Pyruvate/2-oxoacid:ferredoxin oxidoreductase delta subunit
VRLTGNAQQGLCVVYNCCPCCCGALRGIVEFHNPPSLARANFSPEIDRKECTLCLACLGVCPVKAIDEVPGAAAEGSGEKLLFRESQCIGCGLCAAHCPVAAIRMVKVREDLPEKTVPEMMRRIQAEKGN